MLHNKCRGTSGSELLQGTTTPAFLDTSSWHRISLPASYNNSIEVIVIMKSIPLAAGLIGLSTAASWPNGPFITSGSSIVDASGNVVTYAGANWPGAADVMIPEGLQYQSVANIVAKLTEAGINVIRLTYAIELVDQIYENGGVDVPISTAFVEALGESNGTAVFQEVLKANPSFSEDITRLEVSTNKARGCPHAPAQFKVSSDH